MRKGEIACKKQFLLFLQGFPPFRALIFHFKRILKCRPIWTCLKFCHLVMAEELCNSDICVFLDNISSNLLIYRRAHRSVSNVKKLRIGHWFNPRLGQCSFQGLMVVIATEFIPLSHHCPLFQQRLCGKVASAWKECCDAYWLKVLQENMDRHTDHCDITEMLFETALNTIQSTTFVSCYVEYNPKTV